LLGRYSTPWAMPSTLISFLRLMVLLDVFHHFCKILFWGEGWQSGIWTQGFMLARQVLYFLNYTSIHFCSGYFGDRVLLFAWTAILFYIFQHSWDDRCTPPHQLFSVEMGSHKLFDLDWPRTTILPISVSHMDWYDRSMPMCPAMVEMRSCELSIQASLKPWFTQWTQSPK
jgi:hypothetical protein